MPEGTPPFAATYSSALEVLGTVAVPVHGDEDSKYMEPIPPGLPQVAGFAGGATAWL